MFEVGIVTLNLRCYIMVVLCLISPDFAIWSLALHRHLVSVVFKRLSTLKSLLLTTLAPMFFFSFLVRFSIAHFSPSCLYSEKWKVALIILKGCIGKFFSGSIPLLWNISIVPPSKILESSLQRKCFVAILFNFKKMISVFLFDPHLSLPQ